MQREKDDLGKRQEEQERQERAQKQGRDQVLESGKQGRHGSIDKE